MDDLAHAVAMLNDKQRILAFTGAGISTESGIPDFRGPEGVWTKIDPSEFTYDKFVTQPSTRIKSWERARSNRRIDAEPNEGHRALVRLWEGGRLSGCVTQNVDGLHQLAGLPAEVVIELHGNARSTSCLSCGRSRPTREVVTRVEAGDKDPACTECGGILKIDVISFGQAMPEEETGRAFELARECDAVIAIGSTLSVYPAAWVTLEARDAGATFVIINQGVTEQDHMAHVRLEGKIGELLPALVGTLVPAPPSGDR
jgi:NAD-dependent deacetylase